ncbi:MAG: alginate export family protein, partial [Myxococcota bacterium]
MPKRSLLLALALLGLPATSEAEGLDAWLEPILQGTVKLDMRARYEYADISGGPDASHALTLRTRLGYGTKPWQGASVYFEAENIAAADSHAFFDGIPPTNGKSIVADPDVTEVNQAYLLVEREDFGRSMARIGRQRLVLDDQRFIGNVGWRQNEQTYDAAFAGSGLGIDGLTVQYGYLLDVNRIFGNQGDATTRDFESNSHLVRVAYEVAPWLEATTFAYVLDLRDSPLNSSNTFGTRATGGLSLCDDWRLDYQASYAYQVDGGTSGGNNPLDYEAHYVLVDLALGHAPVGTLGA